MFGRESVALACKMEKAKQEALNRLVIKSVDIGGNAIIGIDFDYVTFSGNMIGVSANGTSVEIRKIITDKNSTEYGRL